MAYGYTRAWLYPVFPTTWQSTEEERVLHDMLGIAIPPRDGSDDVSWQSCQDMWPFLKADDW